VSTFINSDITNGGRILIAKNYLGQQMNFTRIVMGDGYLPQGVPPREMTDVVSGVVNVPISKMKVNADGTVIIGGMFSNSDISTEFFYRELALFAEGADNVEVLYCYGNAGEFAERITPVGGSSVIEKAIDIVTAIGTTDNITATIIRTTTADEISYNDTSTNIGATSLQEAVEILAKNNTEQLPSIVISETEPTEPCEIWLKPTGQSEFSTGTPSGVDPDEPEQTTQTMFFYLAHYFDKTTKRFLPLMYMNTAQNIALMPGGAESVADVIAQLQTARAYTLSELYAHIGNTEVHAAPGQMENIFTSLGELVLHVDDLGIHVTPTDKAAWNNAAIMAAQALAAANAANGALEQFDGRIASLEDSVFSNITANPFSITFDNLAGIFLVKGIWNRERQRIEC
jgi:hypothetical protein